MTEYEDSFTNYINDNHLRVSVALAIALIRLKPPDLDILTFVKNLQAHLIDNTSKSEISNFESAVLKRLQTNSLSEIANLLPAVNTEDGDRDCILKKVTRIFELPPAAVSQSQESDNLNDEDADIRENAQFIQFMVRLKTALLSSNTVRINVEDGSKSSEDSGFDSCYTNASSHLQLKYISSSLFSHIIYSPVNRNIILKSVDHTMCYILKMISLSPDEYFYYWKGSVLEEYIFTIKEASIFPDVSDSISGHLKSSLQQLWNNNNIDDICLLDRKLNLISKMFFNCQIILDIIDFLSTKLKDVINEQGKRIGSNYSIENELEELTWLEKIPRFSRLIYDLLKKWSTQKRNKKESGALAASTSDESKRIGVALLWKTKSTKQTGDQMIQALCDQETVVLDNLQQLFDNLMVFYSTRAPLISQRVCLILSEIKQLKKIFSND